MHRQNKRTRSQTLKLKKEKNNEQEQDEQGFSSQSCGSTLQSQGQERNTPLRHLQDEVGE